MPGQNMKPKKQVATKSTGGLPRSRKSGTDTSANGSVPDSSNGHGMEVDINTESHAPGTSSRSTSKSKNNNKRKASASGPENVPSLSPPDSDAESDIHLPHSVSSQLKNLKLGGGADQFLGLGPRQDPKERREIRRKYSQLREEAQARHHDLIRPGSDGLHGLLDRANGIYSTVKEPREAALDSGVVEKIAQMGRMQAQALHTDFQAFEPAEFADKLITAISGIRLVEGESSEARISPEGWIKLGEAAQPFFRRSPPLRLMFGAFERAPLKKRETKPKTKEVVDSHKGPKAPKVLKTFSDTDRQEVTTVEVEKMLKNLQEHYVKFGKPLCYFEFVIDPRSFGQTVENMFYCSFLVRDGAARVFLDEDKLPVIEPVQTRDGSANNTSRHPNHQVVMSLTQQEWRDLVKVYSLK